MKNLFIDTSKQHVPYEYVQYHAKASVAGNGDYYDGYIEHNLDTDEWIVICLTYETSDDWLNNDQDWGMCGSGKTLVEAVNKLKANSQYQMYPLMLSFK